MAIAIQNLDKFAKKYPHLVIFTHDEEKIKRALADGWEIEGVTVTDDDKPSVPTAVAPIPASVTKPAQPTLAAVVSAPVEAPPSAKLFAPAPVSGPKIAPAPIAAPSPVAAAPITTPGVEIADGIGGKKKLFGGGKKDPIVAAAPAAPVTVAPAPALQSTDPTDMI